MITENYVSYKVAELLREKGFDERTRAVYYVSDKSVHYCTNPSNYNNGLYVSIMAAPTQQMAMGWLREIHYIYIEISLYKTSEDDIEPKKSRKTPYYTFGVWNAVTGDNIDKRLTNNFIGDTYEEAVEAALKYVLEKLI